MCVLFLGETGNSSGASMLVFIHILVFSFFQQINFLFRRNYIEKPLQLNAWPVGTRLPYFRTAKICLCFVKLWSLCSVITEEFLDRWGVSQSFNHSDTNWEKFQFHFSVLCHLLCELCKFWNKCKGQKCKSHLWRKQYFQFDWTSYSFAPERYLTLLFEMKYKIPYLHLLSDVWSWSM